MAGIDGWGFVNVVVEWAYHFSHSNSNRAYNIFEKTYLKDATKSHTQPQHVIQA